jgi:hypothetical protein
VRNLPKHLRFQCLRRASVAAIALSLLTSGLTLAAEANQPIETIEVKGSRAEVRKQVQTFVTAVTRKEGKLIGRWEKPICPMIVGVSDDQAAFIRHRLLEIEAEARKRAIDESRACRPNLFVILTDETQQVLDGWKARDPKMFRWKTREGITRSMGEGPVRTWHNAVEVATGGDDRVVSSASEFIENVVVLVDATRTSGISLAQLADYLVLVSLSQIDASAEVPGVQSMLQLFGATTQSAPVSLTEWDRALLHALYRTSYPPAHQRMDLMARMTRELAPR